MSSRAGPGNQATDSDRPRVVVLGGGFAGIQCVQRLHGAGAEIVLVDRNNYHLFQPLLYQVATAMLSPADITATLRSVFHGFDDVRTLRGEAMGLDPDARVLVVGEREVPYDYLVVAAGFSTRYPPGEDWGRHTLELKSLESALEIRSRFLSSLELAEWEDDPEERARLLTTVVIGGGPTGVELAGAFAEAAHRIIPREYRRLEPDDVRVVLVEMESELLPGFSEPLRPRARQLLEGLGVEVLTDTTAAEIDERGVTTESGRRLDAGAIVWCAAVGATELAADLPAERGPQGRLEVASDCSLPDHPEIFVVGDLAYLEQEGKPIPAMAPAAIQMGRHAARAIRCDLDGRGERPEFRFRDKGQLATVGYSSAVASIGGRDFTGFPAWVLWGIVHIAYLIGFRNRLAVLWQWLWAWLTRSREVRLITTPGSGRREATPRRESTSGRRG